MQDTIYTIDRNQLSSLVNRLRTAMFKKMGVIILSVSVLQYFSVGRHDFKLFLVSTIIVATFALLFPQLTLRKKLRRVYDTFKIVLNDEGVEVKAEGIPYKSISWNNLIVKEQINGTIDLYDNRISKMSRKWTGSGWIRIQPEIANRDMLLNELRKRAIIAV